jgi:hypothetical protein
MTGILRSRLLYLNGVPFRPSSKFCGGLNHLVCFAAGTQTGTAVGFRVWLSSTNSKKIVPRRKVQKIEDSGSKSVQASFFWQNKNYTLKVNPNRSYEVRTEDGVLVLSTKNGKKNATKGLQKKAAKTVAELKLKK